MTRWLRILWIALLGVLMAVGQGCDFEIEGGKPGTSVGFDDGVVDLNDFVDDGSACVAKTSGEREVEGYKINSYRGVGTREGDQASERPPTSSVVAQRTSGVCPGETSPRSPIDATASDEVWYTNGGGGSFLACAGAGATDCGRGDSEACSGVYGMEIRNEQGERCNRYDPVEIHLTLASSGARRRVDEATTCAPGSGRFRFLPAKSWDRDEDGLIGAELVPVRMSGTGELTSAAWITSVKVVEGAHLAPRIIKVDEDFAPDAADRLVDAEAVSIRASAAGRVAEGVLSGYAPFVVEGVDRADLGELVVDLGWTCGEGGAPAADRGDGTVLDLAAAGCGVDQRLVLRPAADHLRVELYGDPNHVMKVPATRIGGALVFDHERDRLSLAGALSPTSPTGGAVLRLDRATWLGLPLCEEGRHALRAL